MASGVNTGPDPGQGLPKIAQVCGTSMWAVDMVRCGKRRRVDALVILPDVGGSEAVCDRESESGSEVAAHISPPGTATVDDVAEGDALGVPVIRWWTTPDAIDSPDRGARLLAGLLNIPIGQFEAEHLFKKPLIRLLSRTEREKATSDRGHPIHMLRLDDIDALLRRQHPAPARFLDDVDVTKWVGGERVALEVGHGLVDPDKVWHAFKDDGFSVRLVHPQQWHPPLYELCACLQEYFGNVVTCSSYLTPPQTQGFGPHFDDAEIFVIQLLGRKRWRLYNRPDAATAPRTLSVTPFQEADLGPVLADFVLQPGDVVYFPRGTVHQAVALDSTDADHEDNPSLHLTFSTYRRHTWFDLLERIPGAATAVLRAERVPGALHDDLPIDLLDQCTAGRPDAAWRRLGAAAKAAIQSATTVTKTRRNLFQKTQRGLNAAIDAYATQFLTDSLPPLGTSSEPLPEPPTIDEHSVVRLRFRRSAWLVNEGAATHDGCLEEWSDPEALDPEWTLTLYVTTLNSRVYAAQGESESTAPRPPPAFQVLPELARAVLAVLEAPMQASVLVSALPVHPNARDDLHTLLALLVQHHVLELSERSAGAV